MTENERALFFWLVVSMVQTFQARQSYVELQGKLIDTQFKLMDVQEELIELKTASLSPETRRILTPPINAV